MLTRSLPFTILSLLTLVAGCSSRSFEPSHIPQLGAENSEVVTGSYTVNPSIKAAGKITTVHSIELIVKRPENTTWVEVRIQPTPAPTPASRDEFSLYSSGEELNMTNQALSDGTYSLIVNNETRWRGGLTLAFRPTRGSAEPTIASSVQLDVKTTIYTREGYDTSLAANATTRRP